MTKQQLDRYIAENYAMLFKIAKGLNTKNHRTYDGSILISEAYIHVLNILDKIENEGMLQRYIIANINMNSRYRNSKTNRQEKLSGDELIPECEQDNAQSLYNYALKYYNNADQIERIMFNAYFHEGHNSIRKFAAYFCFSTPTGAKLINKMKSKIKSYEEI